MHDFDVAVIGQGYAGLCAARAVRKTGLRCVALEGVMAGGAVMTVLQLDPTPEAFTTSGPDLGAIIGMDNIDAGVVPVLEPVTALAPLPQGGWRLQGPFGALAARTVILATGTIPRLLGVPGEQVLTGKGVSHCADCDGPALIGRDCVVVGGGDAAFQEAAILARVARQVTIILRGDRPRARNDLVEKALGCTNVSIRANARVTAILGEHWVTGVRLDDAADHLPCEGVFTLIGGIPDSALLPPGLAVDVLGGIVTDPHGALAAPGLWAAGSVRSGFTGGLREAGEDAKRVVEALVASQVSVA